MRFFASRHTRRFCLLATAVAISAAVLTTVALTTAGTAQAGGQSLSQLNSQLGANQATQSNLQSDITALDSQIANLNRQITLVRGRESDVRAQLATDNAQLDGTKARLTVEQNRLAQLHRALAHARRILSAQLVSEYEHPAQDIVTVVLTAGGFRQMLNQLQFLRDAQHSQQQIIAFVTRARAAANRAANQLKGLKARETQTVAAAATQARALQGMNDLLSSRQDALSHVEAARQTALANAKASGGALRSAIARIKAQQAAAARAAAAAQARAEAAAQAAAQATAQTSSNPSSSAPAGASSPTSAVPSGGWAIPEAVVMCESGGQNLPPNSAGASGYYQILPSTWTGEGGSGPAAYLAPKSEQDAIAAKLWNGGAGASNWVCAGIVGIT